MKKAKKLNLGAGTDIRVGFINHDILGLDGIDVIHDLEVFPWPWSDESVELIVAKDVIEHLGDFVKTMEELHRLLEKGGLVQLKVPYWNSHSAVADPTHKNRFHEITFQFFDPNTVYCKDRPYYTTARFEIVRESFVLAPFRPYLPLPFAGEIRVSSRFWKRIIGFVGNTLSNIILDLELEIRKV